jgi:hypothetical protein
MSNHVFTNDQNVVECLIIGNQTVQSVQSMGKELERLISELGSQHKPALVLDDISQIGQVPPAARSQVINLAKSLPYDRLAMLGKGGVIRLGANLLIRASGRGRKMKYFSDREQALAWLHAAQPKL